MIHASGPASTSLRFDQSILTTLLVLALVFALSTASADGQQAQKLPRVVFLSAATASANGARIDAFTRGLKEVGYVNGKNITFEQRYAEGSTERLKTLAAELARDKVDVIVTGGATATRPAKEATSTIPIVMTNDNDPVASGFVASLARPGGNVTGLSTLSPEISGKQLELLKEIVPKISRAALIWNSSTPGNAEALKETDRAAAALGIKLQHIETPTAKDIEAAFNAVNRARAEGLLVLQNVSVFSERAQIAARAIKIRLPAIFPSVEYVEAGGLVSYGVSVTDLFRRAAVYVDKILKGTKPVDLPVEQPTKFEFVISLKTAKQIGLTIPPNVLVRADRVIR